MQIIATSASNAVASGASDNQSGAVGRATTQARAILETAQRERICILQQATSEAKSQALQAQQHGYQKGLNDARHSISSFIEQEKEKLFSSKDSIVSLALKIAEEVTLSLVKLDRASLIERVQRALSLLNESELLTVVINPTDHKLLAAELNDLSLSFSAAIEEDHSLELGTARIINGSATVISDPKLHLNRFKEVLTAKV